MPHVPHRHRTSLRPRFRAAAAGGLALAALLTLAPGALATGSADPAGAARPAAPAHPRPADTAARISTAHVLPGDRVYPEGIAADPDTGALYMTSFTTGAVFRATPGHRAAEVFLPAGTDGRTTAGGLKVDRAGRLWVVDQAGLSVYDTSTRRLLARFEPAAPPASGRSDRSDGSDGSEAPWLNDVAIAPDGSAYVTDSRLGVVYRVTPRQLRAAEAAGGRAPLRARYDLRGALDPHPSDAFALNGIVADPSGRYLLTVDMTGGDLYRVDLVSSDLDRVDLRGADLVDGDGLELRNGTLWAAHNRSNSISRWRLTDDGRTARLERRVTDPALQIPTTLVRRHGRILVVRSQFDKGGPMGPGTPEGPFTVAAVDGI